MKYINTPYGEINHGGRDYFREYVQMRDNHTCQKCGRKWNKGERRFDVHHLDESMIGKTRDRNILKYDRENMDKLITFCHSCHFKWHIEHGHYMGGKISLKKLSTVQLA